MGEDAAKVIATYFDAWNGKRLHHHTVGAVRRRRLRRAPSAVRTMPTTT